MPAVGTPFYCYSTATLTRHYGVCRGIAGLDALVCYAMKANSNQAVLATLARLAPGRCRIGGTARAAADRAGSHRLSGVGKTALKWISRWRAFAASMSIEPELELLSARAVAAADAPVSLRINPMSIRKRTARLPPVAREAIRHRAARARDAYRRAAAPRARRSRIDMHIGSQITRLRPFDDAFAIHRLVQQLWADGHRIETVVWRRVRIPIAMTMIRRRCLSNMPRSFASMSPSWISR